jgi:hypothetical protein
MKKYLESKIEGGIWACAPLSTRSAPALSAKDKAFLERISSSGNFTLEKALTMYKDKAVPGDKK